MAKKCPSCGFADNPDDAHYCGKCGKNMLKYDLYDHRWGLYDATHYVLVERSKLKEYERYEQKAKDSIWKKIWEKYKFDIGLGLFLICCLLYLVEMVYLIYVGIQEAIQYFVKN